MKDEMDVEILATVVGRLLHEPNVRLLDWDIVSAHGGYTHSLTGGVYRLSGLAETGNGRSPWSLILKVVNAPENPTGLDNAHYWKREFLAYQSGLLDYLSDQLVAPRCLLAQDMTAVSYWLWLEDAAGKPGDELGDEWPLAHFEVAGRHLGQFNGRYLDPNNHPSYPWLSRNWLRAWLQDYAHLPALLAEDATWSHPFVHNIMPITYRERLLQLWQDQEKLLQALQDLPQTLCHLDAFRPNLFARYHSGLEETVIIDWDKTGFGAVGEELGGMVPASMIWFRVDAVDARAFGELAFKGYMQGLRQASWQGDEPLVRLGFTASAALRWGIPGVFWLKGTVDSDYAEMWVDWWHRPIHEMLPQWVLVTGYLLDLADEARDLLGL
jgi:hypothetical protein